MAAAVSVLAVTVTVGRGAAAAVPMAGAASRAARADLVRFRVPSPSMLPTLKVGATIIVDLRAYAGNKPRIGDIVVFHPPRGADSANPHCGNPGEGAGYSKPCGVPTPQRSRQTFVERVVGLAGERISIVNGHVIRNGVRDRDAYIAPCGRDPLCNFREPVVIPPDDYFTMGDNRGAADDGRFWGPVRKSWILGKVISVIQ